MERTKRFILASVSKRRLLSFLALLLSTIMYAQSEISGTVIDATGETVIGAMVKEKGTSTRVPSLSSRTSDIRHWRCQPSTV